MTAATWKGSSPKSTVAEAYRGRVSVKGVVIHHGQVALALNDRAEWELPGGQLELAETPDECVARELAEELGLTVEVGPIIDSWLFENIVPGANVFIVTYGCELVGPASLRRSSEHREVRWFEVTELAALPLPTGYRRSIDRWSMAKQSL